MQEKAEQSFWYSVADIMIKECQGCVGQAENVSGSCR